MVVSLCTDSTEKDLLQDVTFHSFSGQEIAGNKNGSSQCNSLSCPCGILSPSGLFCPQGQETMAMVSCPRGQDTVATVFCLPSYFLYLFESLLFFFFFNFSTQCPSPPDNDIQIIPVPIYFSF